MLSCRTWHLSSKPLTASCLTDPFADVTPLDVEEAAPESSLVELRNNDIEIDWELWYPKRLLQRLNNELLVLGINQTMNSYNFYALIFGHVLFLFIVLLQNELFTHWKWWKPNKCPTLNKHPPWKSKNLVSVLLGTYSNKYGNYSWQSSHFGRDDGSVGEISAKFLFFQNLSKISGDVANVSKMFVSLQI